MLTFTTLMDSGWDEMRNETPSKSEKLISQGSRLPLTTILIKQCLEQLMPGVFVLF